MTLREAIETNASRYDSVHEADEIYDDADPDEAAYYAAVYADEGC
jgi:hypothetical protein